MKESPWPMRARAFLNSRLGFLSTRRALARTERQFARVAAFLSDHHADQNSHNVFLGVASTAKTVVSNADRRMSLHRDSEQSPVFGGPPVSKHS